MTTHAHKASSLRVACLQTNPTDSLSANMENLTGLMRQAAQGNKADVLVLPEVFAFMGSEQGRIESASALGTGVFAQLAALAKELGVHVIAGSHAEISPVPGKVYNTSVTFNPHGETVSVYRKIHLFNLRDAEGKPLYCESDVLTPGNTVAGFTLTHGAENWRCLTAICYDLRFPEIFRTPETRAHPYDIIFLPAAFTHQTGQDHWEVLLRARAIENQCYVVACNQTGFHSSGRKRNWGHSCVVDPWGKVVASLSEEVGILSFELSKEAIRDARTRLPALADRSLP